MDDIYDLLRKINGGEISKEKFDTDSAFVTLFVLPHGEAAPKTEPEGEGKATKPEEAETLT